VHPLRSPVRTATATLATANMSDPSYDDDWAELARELERNAPLSLAQAEATRAVKPPPATEGTTGADTASTATSDPAPRGAAVGEAVGPEPEAAEASDVPEAPEAAEAEGGEESAPDSAPDGDGDGVPGTGRKRRRRRRRRRKGSAAGASEPETGTAPADAREPESGDDLAAVEYPSEQGGEPDRDEPGRGEDEREAGEDAGGDLLRELIANWNVPSWDEIVSGLYRPER
jgi:ribonuclease E